MKTMKLKRSHVNAIEFGMVAGMRSMAAPALLLKLLNKHPANKANLSKIRLVNTPVFEHALNLLAAGEFIGDKLPGIPARISPSALSGRILSGAVTGAAVSAASKQKIWIGGVLGAASALASAYISYYGRKKASEHSRLPDTIIAAMEDTLIARLGNYILDKDF